MRFAFQRFINHIFADLIRQNKILTIFLLQNIRKIKSKI